MHSRARRRTRYSCVRVCGRGWLPCPFTILSRLVPGTPGAVGHSLPGLRRSLLAGDCLGRALAGAGVGVGALATYGKPAPMPQPSVAAEIHQPLDVHGDLTPQIAFHHVVTIDDFANLQ